MASGRIVGGLWQSHYKIEIDWIATRNETNNTSAVSAKVYMVSDWAASWSATKNGNTTVNGSSLNWASTVNLNHYDAEESWQRTLIHSRPAITVTHNADGTKSITISAWYEPNVTINGQSSPRLTASKVVTLDSIAVASKMDVWNGTSWVRGNPYVWDGYDWVRANNVYVWNGTSWAKTTS